MGQDTTFRRKSVSIDAELAATLESEADADGRTLSNLVNHRLRQLMSEGAQKTLSAGKRRATKPAARA